MRDLGKLIVAKGLKKLPKVQKIAQSGHTDPKFHWLHQIAIFGPDSIHDQKGTMANTK